MVKLEGVQHFILLIVILLWGYTITTSSQIQTDIITNQQEIIMNNQLILEKKLNAISRNQERLMREIKE